MSQRIAEVADDGPLDRSHPEGICQECGGPNVAWFAPNQLWNAVMGGEAGVVCPICFMLIARRRGQHSGTWRVVPETWDEPWAPDAIRGFYARAFVGLETKLAECQRQLAQAKGLPVTED